MRNAAKAGIRDGEMYGAPVPGGWPGRGPFRVLRDALGKPFRSRRRLKDAAEAERREAGTGDADE